MKGRVTYVPKNVLDTLDNIKSEKNIFDQADAFQEFNNYANLGREVEKIKRRMFGGH